MNESDQRDLSDDYSRERELTLDLSPLASYHIQGHSR